MHFPELQSSMANLSLSPSCSLCCRTSFLSPIFVFTPFPSASCAFAGSSSSFEDPLLNPFLCHTTEGEDFLLLCFPASVPCSPDLQKRAPRRVPAGCLSFPLGLGSCGNKHLFAVLRIQRFPFLKTHTKTQQRPIHLPWGLPQLKGRILTRLNTSETKQTSRNK